MTDRIDIDKTTVNVSSEYGHLNAVLLHRPGVEIERMTPANAAEALYSDILSKHIVDKEYASFCGVFEKWTKVYYVEDVLATLMDFANIRQMLVKKSCELDGCKHLTDRLLLPLGAFFTTLVVGWIWGTDKSIEEATSNGKFKFALAPVYAFMVKIIDPIVIGIIIVAGMVFGMVIS